MDESARAALSVARSVLGDLDVDVVLQRVLASACELTGAQYAALGVLDESRGALARFVTLGIDEPTRAAIGPLPSGRGVLGELIRSPVPLRVADVSKHPRSFGFPVGHPPMRSFLGVPVTVAGEPYGNLYLADKRDGDEFTDEDEEAAVLLAELAALALDHARRYTRADDERRELQTTVDALDATIQIARALGGYTDLTAILELVAKRGRALVAARAVVIELVSDQQLVVAAAAGELPADLIGHRVELKDTVAEVALRRRESQLLSEQPNQARFEQHGLGRFGLTAKDGFVVPLLFRNETYGVLIAIDRIDGSPFTSQHLSLLEAFSASAATAVATAHSAADERRRETLAAAEAERARWARELHDETLQGLANLRVVLGAAQRTGKPEVVEAAVAKVMSQLELDIASLRGLVADLRPAALDQIGLEAAIHALADRLFGTGVAVEVELDLAYEQGRAPDRLIPELEIAIYRIAQESLTNAARHGDATRATVTLVEDDSTVTLSVRDDGQGFDPAAGTQGFGLRGMHERAALLGGALHIDAAPGRGVTVTTTFPARHPGSAPALGDVVPASRAS